MKDQSKTKQVLIQELASLRQRIEELEQSESLHKPAEEALKDHEAELASIYEHAPLIMLLVDEEWTIRKTNAYTARYVGKAVGDIINLRCGKSLHCIHSLDAPEGCGFGPSCGECTLRLTALNTIETGHGHHKLEVRMSLSDGEKIREAFFLLSTARLTMKGQLMALVSMQDITDSKQAEDSLHRSEENFRHSFDDSPMGIRIVTAEGETIYANRAILDVYGYDNIEELKTTPAEKRYIHESYAEFQIRREERKRGDDGPSEYEISIIRKDGEVRHLQVLRSEILWDGERQFQVLYNDITDRKRAEEELSTSRLQLRTLATRLQQIREEERLMVAREIHDEMGGGLTGLKMDLSWLLHKLGDTDPCDERAALMDKIHTSSALIDQMILVVRRISTDLRPSVLDDLGLIAALEWQLSEFTSHTEIPHEFATTVEYVNMEKDTAVAVFRIFQEALTNVLRHSGATKVTVVLREEERGLFGNESFVLEIRDNGRGITEEELMNPGSLGLLGMKERAHVFGGELSLSGEPDGGTSVILKIPQDKNTSPQA
jgi:PAS domain S-box-containing protein